MIMWPTSGKQLDMLSIYIGLIELMIKNNYINLPPAAQGISGLASQWLNQLI